MRKKYDELTDEDLARVCHEAHVALRVGLNDSATDVRFDALPQERKDLVTNEVRLIRAGRSPAEVHGTWVEWMKEHDWEWGEERDPVRKTHPDMVSYEELPPEEKAKVRQAFRIVFTHVLPDALDRIAYRDIRTRPVEAPDMVEELPGE